MLSTACPKPAPRWQEKQRRRAEETKRIKACYAQVDRRDGPHCRVCGRRVGGLGMVEARQHHHLTYRSRGGAHTSANLVSLCRCCHGEVHDGLLRLSGDADARRQEDGRLGGVLVERWSESGWIAVGCV